MFFLKTRLKEIYQKKDLLASLIVKNLKGKYMGSRLGFGWSILNPILLAFVVSFVFTNVFQSQKTNFTSFVLSGLLPWFFFASSLSESASSILNGKSLLRQFPIPVEMFPLSATVANFIIFLTGLSIMLPFFIWTNPLLLPSLPYLILLLIIFCFFVIGISFIIAVLNILFRDTAHILNIGLMLWMWVTPIFYSIDAVPLPYSRVYYFNPMCPFIYLFHVLLHDNAAPVALYFLRVFALSVFVFIGGYGFFLKLEDKLIKSM